MKFVRKCRFEIEKCVEYDFNLSAAAYSFSWNFDGKFLRIRLDIDDKFVVVRCYEDGNKIIVDVYGRYEDSINRDLVIEKVVYSLGISEDLSKFYELCRGDPILKDVLIGLHMRSVDPWYATIIAVSQQNASFRQGWSMIYKLHVNYGSRIYLEDDKVFITIPDPKYIVERGESILRDCGYGYRSSIVVNIAKRFLEYGDYNLYKILKDVKGVGPYTYGLSLVLAYRDYSKPVIDRWVRGLYNFVGIKDVDNYFRNYWRDYQGLVTWFLTVMLDAEPLSRALERIRKGVLRPVMKGLTPLTMWRYL